MPSYEPGQQALRGERIEQVAEAVRRLPDWQRQAVVLDYWQGSSLAEIAEGLGRSVPAVAALLHRGLQQPDDLAIDPKDARTGLTGQAGGGFYVLMVDGSVQRLPDSIDPQNLGWLFQRNDGHRVNLH